MSTTAESNPRSVAEYPLSGGKLVLSLEGTTPAWAEPTLRALGHLLSLSPGWDSYGARRIDLALALTVVPLLSAIMHDDTPPPAVVPTNRGGIQLEWHERGIDLAIEVIDAGHVLVSFEDAQTDEVWDKKLTEDLHELAHCITQLSDWDSAIPAVAAL